MKRGLLFLLIAFATLFVACEPYDEPGNKGELYNVTCGPNQIIYKTKFDTLIDLNLDLNWGHNVNLVSNVYENGYGVITFDLEVIYLPSSAFENYAAITDIKLPSQLSTIGTKAFYGCLNLENVFIPNSVNIIHGSAFYGCSSLVNINIPESVNYIEGRAFYGCSSLVSINVSENVKDIGYEAFADCNNLMNVYCKPIIPPMTMVHSSYWIEFWDAFKNNAVGRKIYVPKGSVGAYKSASYWSDYADDIVGYDF